MSTNGHPIAHLWWALLLWFARLPHMQAWLAANPSPAVAIAERRQHLWEYNQADAQSWDNEPDKKGLAEALAVRHSEPERAFSLLLALARKDSPIAVNDIGEVYYWGQARPRDVIEGEKWFKRAFELGSRRGLLHYGKALSFRKDFAGAEAVFRQGADDGWAPAFYWLARTEIRREPSLKTVLRTRPYLERAAEMGSPMAAPLVALPLLLGFLGLRHVPRGVRLFSAWIHKMEEPPPRKNAAGDTIH